MGFVGQNLMEALAARNWRIVALALPGTGTPAQTLPGVVTVFADITDYAQTFAAMPEAPDAVFHLAANTSSWSKNDDRQDIDNILGTAILVKVALARHAKRFILTSSISAYGPHPGKPFDEETRSNALLAGNHYGKTKFEAERVVKDAAIKHGLSAVILNPVNILGPRDSSNWSKELIRPALDGTSTAVPPGRAMFCHVRNVVDAHIAAVDRGGTSGENYLLGGVEVSFKEVIDEVRRFAGRPPSKAVTPRIAIRGALSLATLKSKLDGKPPFLTPERYARAVGYTVCNYDKAVSELGYQTTPLREIVEDTCRSLTSTSSESGLAATVKRDAQTGTEFVEVDDEPHHDFHFVNPWVRVYTATIAPGARTLFHRHAADTLYVVIRGGVFKTELVGHPRYGIGFPKSVDTATKVRWGARRLLTGSLDLPTSNVFAQYNKDVPMIHRISADPRNEGDVQFMGIELLRRPMGVPPTTAVNNDNVEFRDRNFRVRRLLAPPRQLARHERLLFPSLCIVTKGAGQVNGAALGVGDIKWIDHGEELAMEPAGSHPLEVLAVSLG
jgi:nucleoside-diphosphate-sugar epimerase